MQENLGLAAVLCFLNILLGQIGKGILLCSGGDISGLLTIIIIRFILMLPMLWLYGIYAYINANTLNEQLRRVA